MKSIEIYTDGCCLGNPGPGGYGVILEYQGHQKELCGGYQLTTNNRMEIMACIVALQALKQPCLVTLTTDSQYVAKAINEGWALRWKAKGWRRSDNKPAENADLWEVILELIRKHQVRIVWVKGHNGHPKNERCDQLAKLAANGIDLREDSVYIQSQMQNLHEWQP